MVRHRACLAPGTLNSAPTPSPSSTWSRRRDLPRRFVFDPVCASPSLDRRQPSCAFRDACRAQRLPEAPFVVGLLHRRPRDLPRPIPDSSVVSCVLPSRSRPRSRRWQWPFRVCSIPFVRRANDPASPAAAVRQQAAAVGCMRLLASGFQNPFRAGPSRDRSRRPARAQIRIRVRLRLPCRRELPGLPRSPARTCYRAGRFPERATACDTCRLSAREQGALNAGDSLRSRSPPAPMPPRDHTITT